MKYLIAFIIQITLLAGTTQALANESSPENTQQPSVAEDTNTPAETNKKEGFFSSLKQQIIQDLNHELDNSQELSDVERDKITRAIDALENMETLSDLKNINDILELDIGTKHDHHKDFNKHYDPHANNSSMLVDILGVVFFFGAPIAIVGILSFINLRKTRLQHTTLTKIIESGQEIPADLLNQLQGSPPPKNYLQKGLTLCGVALGLLLAAIVMGSKGFAAVALIPLFIGASQLLIWKLEQKDQSNSE